MNVDEALETVAAPWRYELDTVDEAADVLASAVRRVRELCNRRERDCESVGVPISSAHLSPAAVRQALDGTP